MKDGHCNCVTGQDLCWDSHVDTQHGSANSILMPTLGFQKINAQLIIHCCKYIKPNYGLAETWNSGYFKIFLTDLSTSDATRCMFNSSLIWIVFNSSLIGILFNSSLIWILFNPSMTWMLSYTLWYLWCFNYQFSFKSVNNLGVANHTCRLFRTDWFPKLRWSLTQPSQILSIASNEVIVACDQATDVKGQCATVNRSGLCPCSATTTTCLHHVTGDRRTSIRLWHIPGNWYPSISHVCHSKIRREGRHIWKHSTAVFLILAN